MNEVTRITITFAAVGMLFILISIPLILERVPPNNFYGFRTRKTLSDPKIWYAANRVSGWGLLAAGNLIETVSLVMLVLARDWNPEHATFTLLSVMILSLTGALLHGFKALKRL